MKTWKLLSIQTFSLPQDIDKDTRTNWSSTDRLIILAYVRLIKAQALKIQVFIFCSGKFPLVTSCWVKASSIFCGSPCDTRRVICVLPWDRVASTNNQWHSICSGTGHVFRQSLSTLMHLAKLSRLPKHKNTLIMQPSYFRMHFRNFIFEVPHAGEK